MFWGGASRDTKTIDFWYKRYPPKISGYVTDEYKLQLKNPTQIYSAVSLQKGCREALNLKTTTK